MYNVHFSSYIRNAKHGFMKARSDYTNLVEFANIAYEAVKSGSQFDATVYTDFSQAFDIVNHTCILNWLYNIGIHSSQLNLLESYLIDIGQHVKINNCLPNVISVSFGVPQGSHLGSLIYLLMM